MYTYQDLLNVGDDENKRIDFIHTLIESHKTSDDYKLAMIAQAYDKGQGVTITSYRKLLYTISGEAVEDNFSANYKIGSNFFNRFVTQESQYLLGNGVSWNEDETSDKLGEDFDTRLQELGRDALVDKVSFGFWNYDHMEVFRLTEFMPLYDEEDGAMKAGIRFWQIDDLKPLRATLYELDGYTNYIWRKGERGAILKPKRGYKAIYRYTDADGEEIFDYENYPSFPIIPLWGNPAHQSEIVSIREGIDAYDLIKSGFANDLDDASQIYWIINNAGGMDDIDLAQFVKRIKTVKAAVVEDDGARAESHTIEVPYASREALLERLRNDLYDDFMALDTKQIASGATTATQIKAAYEPLNNKADMFEYCVLDFIQGLLFVAGIDDSASFTRSMIVNAQEQVQTLLQAATHLPDEYVTRKILEILGDADKVEEILEEMLKDEINRAAMGVSDEIDATEEGNRSDTEGYREEGREGVFAGGERGSGEA